MIITIDGPAGSGKSAAALKIAGQLGYPHLDTGAMYRAVALDLYEQGLLDLPEEIANRCRLLSLDFDWSQPNAPILLNGKNVAEAIRTPHITAITWQAADNPWVREELVKRQRIIGAKCVEIRGGMVTEGRDQGTIVFPKADFKFYLDAHPEVRAQRRISQLADKGISADIHDVLEQIVRRDMRDQGRAHGPLARPADAIILDTTDVSLDDVVEKMVSLIHERTVSGSRH